jgi:hypothetical protein
MGRDNPSSSDHVGSGSWDRAFDHRQPQPGMVFPRTRHSISPPPSPRDRGDSLPALQTEVAA